MIKIQVPKNGFYTAKIIAEIFEIYADAGIPGPQIEAMVAAAIISGQEGPLVRHSVWKKLPTELRVPLAQTVSEIANLAWRLRSEGLSFAESVVEAKKTDYVRSIGETIEYLVKLLSEGKSVTITKPTDYKPYVVTIRASGYPDKIVNYFSFLNTTMTLGIQLKTEANPEIDEVFLYT